MTALASAIFAGIAMAADSRPDIVLQDFEQGYGNWKAEGEAFNKSTQATGRIAGVVGSGVADSSGGKRQAFAGKLISPEFKIERNYIRLLLAGSEVWVLVDGKREFSLSSKDIHVMSPRTLDVSSFQGSKARIVVSDSGMWKCVRADRIIASDSPGKGVPVTYPQSQCVPIDTTMSLDGKKYLVVPVNHTAPRYNYVFEVDGEPKMDMKFRLASDREIDCWISYPIGHLGDGEKLRFHSTEPAVYREHLSAIEKQISLSAKARDMEDIYTEPSRPQLRFTVKRGRSWDPNGLYYYDGVWHLFFQYNPTGPEGSNQHWGHATSTNLFDWTQQPFAIPKGLRWMAFSGSGVVDHNNDSGLKQGDHPPILLFYSQNGRSATALAHSTDGGKTYKQYEQNPLFLTNDPAGHDPKVVWYPPDEKWVMIIHDRRDKGPWTFDFYESKNLLDWEYMSSSHDWFETPDLFPMPLDGDTNNIKWVVQDVTHSYRIGEFNGREFIPETKKICNFHGRYLAPQTFNNAPDGRCVMMGTTSGCEYYQNDPAIHAAGGLNIPIDVTLRTSPTGQRLYLNPVEEIGQLVRKRYAFGDIGLEKLNSELSRIEPALFDIAFEWDAGEQKDFVLDVWGVEVFRLHAAGGTYSVKGSGGQRKLYPERDANKARIVCDRGLVSFYINDGYEAGNAYHPHPAFMPRGKPAIRLKGAADQHFASFEVRVLRPMESVRGPADPCQVHTIERPREL